MKRGMVIGFLAAMLLVASLVTFGGQGAAGEAGDIQLWQGWNVVIWESDFATLDEAFGEDAESVRGAYYWRADLQTFRRLLPGSPGQSTIHFLEPGKAYWVLMGGPQP